MALTKAVESITDWTAVAQNAVGESAVLDCSGHYETMLAIQAFLDSTTAHDGTRFIVQVSSATSGDEDWHTLVQFLLLVGTANSENITDNPLSSGSTTISVASTTGYDADTAIYIGIEDGTLADSEICLLVWSLTLQIHLLQSKMGQLMNTLKIQLCIIKQLVK